MSNHQILVPKAEFLLGNCYARVHSARTKILKYTIKKNPSSAWKAVAKCMSHSNPCALKRINIFYYEGCTSNRSGIDLL